MPRQSAHRKHDTVQRRRDQKLLRKLERRARKGHLNDHETALLLDLQRTRRHPEHADQSPHTPSPAPDRRLTQHDLITIDPKGPRQRRLMALLDDDHHVGALGSAGTGKTFLTLYALLRNVLDPDHPRNQLVIFRSSVEGRDMGFRPGTTDEKMADFETPYRSACAKLFGRPTAYDKLKEQGVIAFRSTSFERGVDYEHSELLVDEVQNNSLHELDTLITRPAKGSRIVLAGDTIQSDLIKKASDVTGLPLFLDILALIPEFKTVTFLPEDNVRSGISRAYLLARERLMTQRPEAFAKSGMAVATV